MALVHLDAAIRKRGTLGWISFRAVAGLFVAMGLYGWLSVWFERDFWLGVAQAVMCGLVLANELGILSSRRA